ncbi:MAG: transposase, partial [Nitrospiria bacterium]
MSRYLNQLMESEITVFLGRGRYERVKGGRVRNHRNGNYPRQFTIKGIGGVSLAIPRDRLGRYKTEVLPRYQRYENKIKEDLSLMFFTGVSTRTTGLISKRLLGRSLSHTEVSLANQELSQAVEAWRVRDLSSDPIKYLYMGMGIKLLGDWLLSATSPSGSIWKSTSFKLRKSSPSVNSPEG